MKAIARVMPHRPTHAPFLPRDDDRDSMTYRDLLEAGYRALAALAVERRRST